MKQEYQVAVLLAFGLGIIAVIGITASGVANKKPRAPFVMPANATKISEDTYQVEYPHSAMKAYIIVHGIAPHEPQRERAFTDKCRAPIRAGMRWNTNEDWYLDTTNTVGLSHNFIVSALSAAFETWLSVITYNPIGTLYLDTISEDLAYNGRNEVVFAPINLEEGSALAVTLLYSSCKSGLGGFGACANGEEIIEWKEVYNTDYEWGDGSVDQTVYDLQNVATHEHGHVLGGKDIYDSQCSYVVMYGYASKGEINKRTLTDPDIELVQSVLGYGSPEEQENSDEALMPILMLVIYLLLLAF
jgi:hypothetical protein